MCASFPFSVVKRCKKKAIDCNIETIGRGVALVNKEYGVCWVLGLFANAMHLVIKSVG